MAEKKAFPELRTYIDSESGVSLGPVLLRHVVQHIDGQAAEIERMRARLAEIEAQEPVALVKDADEYGPILDWTTHWVELIGAKLYAAPAPAPAQAVPDGWRLVPAEPTHEMLDAAVTDFERERHSVPLIVEVRRASWSRMIAAAPEHKA